jgi:uncharacterized protein (TIGR03435 family)
MPRESGYVVVKVVVVGHERPSGSLPAKDQRRNREPSVRRWTRRSAAGRQEPVRVITSGLSGLGRLGRPVIDQTGLTGRYDFTLEWMPERDGTAPPEAADMQGPTFLEAVREQLGLKLESSKGPVRTPAVDRVERPSEN